MEATVLHKQGWPAKSTLSISDLGRGGLSFKVGQSGHIPRSHYTVSFFSLRAEIQNAEPTCYTQVSMGKWESEVQFAIPRQNRPQGSEGQCSALSCSCWPLSPGQWNGLQVVTGRDES